MMTVRAKFVVASKTEYVNGWAVVLQPVTATNPENEAFFKWTPNGKCEMQILNPDAAEQFVVGESYYIDFTPATVKAEVYHPTD